MNTDYLKTAVEKMRERGVVFEQGLTDSEIAAIEQRDNICFPPDLRAFLQFALPVKETLLSNRTRVEFPQWRTNPNEFRESINWVIEGICLDVISPSAQYRGFWVVEWGQRPDDDTQAVNIARRNIEEMPQLIRIYGHRYLPCDPCEAGNPSFSLSETDIIIYGNDLASYLNVKFHVPLPDWAVQAPRHIRFWSEFDRPAGSPIKEFHLEWN